MYKDFLPVGVFINVLGSNSDKKAVSVRRFQRLSCLFSDQLRNRQSVVLLYVIKQSKAVILKAKSFISLPYFMSIILLYI